MQKPLDLLFRDGDESPALAAKIRAAAERLEKHCHDIVTCRVSVETPHRHRQQGRGHRVQVDVGVSGKELVASREHEDAYVAARDAFDAIERQLAGYAQRRRGEVKRHRSPVSDGDGDGDGAV